jgi:hypothetical protein
MKMIRLILMPCLLFGVAGCTTNYYGPATDNFKHLPPAYWDNTSNASLGKADIHAVPISPPSQLYTHQI